METRFKARFVPIGDSADKICGAQGCIDDTIQSTSAADLCIETVDPDGEVEHCHIACMRRWMHSVDGMNARGVLEFDESDATTAEMLRLLQRKQVDVETRRKEDAERAKQMAEDIEKVTAAQFHSLFDDDYEYPGDRVAEHGVPQDTLYTYISSTFVSGYLNYIGIFHALMFERYNKWGDNFQQQILDAMEDDPHCSYGRQGYDDIICLGETENSWWYVWLDRDVSDCCIGRISKEKVEREVLVAMIKKVAAECSKEYGVSGRMFELPPPTGWVTF